MAAQRLNAVASSGAGPQDGVAEVGVDLEASGEPGFDALVGFVDAEDDGGALGLGERNETVGQAQVWSGLAGGEDDHELVEAADTGKGTPCGATSIGVPAGDGGPRTGGDALDDAFAGASGQQPDAVTDGDRVALTDGDAVGGMASGCAFGVGQFFAQAATQDAPERAAGCLDLVAAPAAIGDEAFEQWAGAVKRSCDGWSWGDESVSLEVVLWAGGSLVAALFMAHGVVAPADRMRTEPRPWQTLT